MKTFICGPAWLWMTRKRKALGMGGLAGWHARQALADGRARKTTVHQDGRGIEGNRAVRR